MGKRLLLDVSPTGVQHSVDIDPDGDGFYAIEFTPSSVESAILDECARKRSLVQGRGRAFKHAAQIPINTYQQWKREWRQHYRDTLTWPEFEVMKLNSRDNCNLRTGHKRSAFGKKL